MAGWGTSGMIRPRTPADSAMQRNVQQLSGAMQGAGATVSPTGGLAYGAYPGGNANYREAAGTVTPQPASTPPIVADYNLGPQPDVASSPTTPPVPNAAPAAWSQPGSPNYVAPVTPRGAANMIGQVPTPAAIAPIATASGVGPLPPVGSGTQANLLNRSGINGNPAAVQPTGQAGGWLPAGWTPEQAAPGTVAAMGIAKGIDPRQFATHDAFVDAVNGANGITGNWLSGPPRG